VKKHFHILSSLWKKKTPWRVALFLLLLSSVSNTTYAIPVEPNHPVYSFLKRINTRLDLDISLNTLPLSRKQIERILVQLEPQSTLFTQVEREHYQEYKNHFLPKRLPFKTRLYFQKNERHVQLQTTLYGVVQYQDSSKGDNAFSQTTITPEIFGQLNDQWSFYSSVTAGQERGLKRRFREHYNPLFGLPYNTPEKVDANADTRFSNYSFDGFLTSLSWENQWYHLTIGNQWHQWGPGVWQHPSLSQSTYTWTLDTIQARKAWEFVPFNTIEGEPLYPNSRGPFSYRQPRRGYRSPGESYPLPQISGGISWEHLQYTKFFAHKIGTDYDSTSYLTGHRLQLQWKRFSIGAYELLSYSRDRIEWLYVIPFASLFIGEHFAGDRDNVSIGMDVEYRFSNQYRVYGELFLDDLVSPTQLFSNFWGNKYASVLGIEAEGLFWSNTTWQLEYSRVEPWVYSHHTRDNQFQTLGSLLGSSLLPNSHRVNTRIQKWFTHRISGDVEYTFYQHQHHDKGSNLFDVFEKGTSSTKNFLGDNPETSHTLEGNLMYQYSRYIRSTVKLGYHWVENEYSYEGQDNQGFLWSSSLLLSY
jgi:hypothetical protein